MTIRNDIRVEFTPEAMDMMATRNIQKDDVIRALCEIKDNGNATLVDEETGVLSARARMGDQVFWVKYKQTGFCRYLVSSAFRHQINVSGSPK